MSVYESTPAFPSPGVVISDYSGAPKQQGAYEGMTLMDYFAAKAMQAAATNPAGADGFTFSQRAEWAYSQASAMMRERKKWVKQ